MDTRIVEMHGFHIEVPAPFSIGERGRDYAAGRGDLAVEITSCGADSILVYRQRAYIPLEVEPVVLLLTEINRGCYEMGTAVEHAEPGEFDGRPAIHLRGYWTHEVWGRGPFEAVGLQCGPHCFAVQAAINGSWRPEPRQIMSSFHWLEET